MVTKVIQLTHKVQQVCILQNSVLYQLFQGVSQYLLGVLTDSLRSDVDEIDPGAKYV